MKRGIYDIIIASIVLLILDGIWIGLIMKPRYENTVKSIQGDKIHFNLIAGNLAYIFLISGLYHFVLSKVNTFNLFNILSEAIPYGLAVYGTFDFTAAAIFKNWDFITSIMDLLWGTYLCTISAIVAIYSRRFFINHSEHIKVT